MKTLYKLSVVVVVGLVVAGGGRGGGGRGGRGRGGREFVSVLLSSKKGISCNCKMLTIWYYLVYRPNNYLILFFLCNRDPQQMVFKDFLPRSSYYC